MGSPYLSSNESILLSTHNVVINTIPAEAILTSQRLMLLDFSHPQILPQDIPFSAIETVTIGENSEKVPVLSLSVAVPDGTFHTIGMTFVPVQRTKRTAERDEWAKKLKELSMAAKQEHERKTAELLPPWVPGELPSDPAKAKEKNQKPENVYRPLRPDTRRRGRSSQDTKKTRTIAMGAGIVILILAVMAGSYVLAPSLWGGGGIPAVIPTQAVTPAPTTLVPTPEPTEIPTPSPTPAPIETTPVTPVPVTTAPTATPRAAIPQTGVWIHVTFEGKYAGSIGTSGGLRDITGSGEGIYQIPVSQGILLASVEKRDSSGNPLTVEFYKDGVLLKSSSTRAPKGVVDAQAEIPVIPPHVIVTSPKSS